MATGTRHFRILIVAATSTEAEAILKRLHAARLPVRGLFTQHPSKLPALLQAHHCDLLLVSVGGTVAASEVASVCRRAAIHTPMLILDGDGQDATGLIELMEAGAQGLIRDLDDGRLQAVVKQRMQQPRIGDHSSLLRHQLTQMDNTQRGLIERCPCPIAMLKDGVIVAGNPALIDLLGLPDMSTLVGQRLSAIAAKEQEAELDDLLNRAQLLEVDDSIPESTDLMRTDGTIIVVKLSLYPIEIAGESRLALFAQPIDSARLTEPNPSIDTETGLPDRNALLGTLAKRLSGEGQSEHGIALVYAVMEDFATNCQRDGLVRGLRYAADTASIISSAMPAGTLTARVADDACAILFEGIADHDSEGLVEQVKQLLATARTGTGVGSMPSADGETPRCRMGVAFGKQGKSSASQLLDQAYAASLRSASAAPQARAGGEPFSELDSVARTLHLDGSQPSGEALSANALSAEADITSEFSSDFSAVTMAATVAASTFPDSTDSSPAQDSAESYLEATDTNYFDDSITATIEQALETDGFSIMYQPIVSLMGDSQEHYSVLLRLRREHERTLTAQELLGPTARAGSLPDIDRWVIQRALSEQAKRRRMGQKVGCFLSLSTEIIQDDRLLLWICDALREFEVRGSWITFQIQEPEARLLADKWTTLADGLKRSNATSALTSLACKTTLNWP